MRTKPFHWVVVMAGCVMAAHACQSGPPPLDLLISGGEVIDGTGAPARRADVGVIGDRVVEVGDLSGRAANRGIDARGLAVTPGFIDVQGQSGTTLLADGRAESHLRQGITTEIIGEAGSPAFWTSATAEAEALAPFGVPFDWSGFAQYGERLQQRGIAVNLGTLVPASQVRREVIGLENRPAKPDELARMEALVDRAMTDGAFGLASALIYVPGSFANTEELVGLARVAARHDGIYVSHVRGESFRLFDALDEAIRIGREANLPVVVYHLKVAARANWGRMDEAVRKLAEAQKNGVSVTATMYPYTAGGTNLNATLPLWVQEGGREAMLARLKDPSTRARARREIETTIDGWENLILGSTFDGIQVASVPPESDQSVVGKRIAEIAHARKQDVWDTYFGLIQQTGGRVGALFHMMSEDDVKTGLAWEGVTIGTDSAAVRTDGPLARGAPHPRAYGTFPRVLAKYVREDKVLSLEEAIRRMTYAAASQFRIPDRGVIRPGSFADLVVFDPATVRDAATYDRPHQYATGIPHVIVNGAPVLLDGKVTDARPGRTLVGPGAGSNHREKTTVVDPQVTR
jgi:N-acyl-D-aspartate/D-glutamate deacylase